LGKEGRRVELSYQVLFRPEWGRSTYLGKHLVDQAARKGALAEVDHDVGERDGARPVEAKEAELSRRLDCAEDQRQSVRWQVDRLCNKRRGAVSAEPR